MEEEDGVEEAKAAPEVLEAVPAHGQALAPKSPGTHRSKPPPCARLLSSVKQKLVYAQAR